MESGIEWNEEGLLKSVTEASIKATWPTKKLAIFWKENSRITAKRLGSSLDCQFRKSPVCSPHCSVVFLIICEEWDSNLWRSHLLTKVTKHLYCILIPLCSSQNFQKLKTLFEFGLEKILLWGQIKYFHSNFYLSIKLRKNFGSSQFFIPVIYSSHWLGIK